VDWTLKVLGLFVPFYESSQSMARLFYQQSISRLRCFFNNLIVYSFWRKEERLFTLAKLATSLKLS
jgi:hypothetical protein